MQPLRLVIISLICIIAAVAVPASAGPADIAVTSFTVDPSVLMKGDTGMLTVEIKNNGADSVSIRSARLYGSGVVALSDSYPAVGDIGSGTTKTFTFTVRADGGEGTFYPVFVLDIQDGGNLRYPIPVQVEDTPLAASIVGKPDTFSEGRTADITVRIGNPRPNDVSGVQVIPQGTGFTVTPTGAFIGALAADGSGTAVFNLTPATETDVTFQVVWRNGINTHTTDLTLPVTFGEDKRQADLFVTNVEVMPEGGRYRIVGDVTNAGLEPARSVLITPDAPAIPTDPFRVYVVGTLDPDDAAPFEVTFRIDVNTTEIPIVVEYRDDDGNRYTMTTIVEIGGAAVATTERDGGIPVMGVIIAVIITISVVGAIYYSWRRT
ncbi:MAG: hypothetical protein GX191_03750 [Candidatus Methanoculleus thermohydrogenotrophicum]|nr:hypothetical protein [Candidatus Methanoculleus thermohydrogenotrophicum]